MTDTELSVIAALAIIGLSRSPRQQGHAEAACHVLELFVRFVLETERDRLEGHTADGARPGTFWRTSGCIGQV